MATDAEVEAGAEVMASLCTAGIIEAPQLPAPCWNGSVRAILEAAEKVRAEQKRKNCTHPSKNGTGSIAADGSSKSTWICRDCGVSGSSETPPRREYVNAP